MERTRLKKLSFLSLSFIFYLYFIHLFLVVEDVISPIDVSQLPLSNEKDILEANKEKENGNALFLKKEWEKCIESYSKAITLNPHDGKYFIFPFLEHFERFCLIFSFLFFSNFLV